MGVGTHCKAAKQLRLLLAVCVCAVALGGLSGFAEAATPPPALWQTPARGQEQTGATAGKLRIAAGIATNPSSGDIYVVDSGNSRIDEFDAWGQFIKSWGWGVRDGAAELQECTSATGCRQGLEGTGAGQFSLPEGIALDPATGDLYVVERAETNAGRPKDNFRVQKFTAAGAFLWMIGKEVDKGPTHPGNICRAAFIAEGDECGAGARGTEPGTFSNEAYGSYLTVGEGGTLFVGDKGRIEEFDEEGAYLGQIGLPEGDTTHSTRSLAYSPVDHSLFFTFAQGLGSGFPEKPFIYEHTAAGWKQFAETGRTEDREFGGRVYGFPEELAVDSAGNLWVSSLQITAGKIAWQEVLEFSSGGNCLLCSEEVELARASAPDFVRSLAMNSGCNLSSSDLLVSRNRGEELSSISAFGPAPDPAVCPPPKVPPTISAQYATSVASDGATVKAQIDPHFWSDTSYYVEYGLGRCTEGRCDSKLPVPPAQLGAGAVDATVTTAGISLPELQPHTTYHFRFVSESSGAPGEPVFGIDPDGEGPGEATFATGVEATFTTPPVVGPPAPCPENQAFRTGAGAFLPDCRAYEMVSPVNKANGDIVSMVNVNSYPAALDQSASSGDALTYSSYRAFSEPESAPYTSQYLANRTERGMPGEGWSGRSTSPPRGPVPILKEGNTLETEFRAFSANLCEAWLMHDTDPVLAPGAVSSYTNLYKTNVCAGEGAYQPLSTGELAPSQPPVSFVPDVQGVSADGSRAFFLVHDKLLSNAAPSVDQVYESSGGPLHLVNLLPGGATCAEPASLGSKGPLPIRTSDLQHAVSENGRRAYWSCGAKLYLHVAGSTESVPVSQTVSNSGAQFWAASATGGAAIFSIGEKLYEYDAGGGSSRLIAGRVLGVLGVSENASVVYAISEEGLAGGPAGKPNLYLFKGSSATFIATLSAADARQSPPGTFVYTPINTWAVRHSARVTPDGLHLAFMSTAPLTGYDSTDAQSGETDAEVFYYSATNGQLSCASCNSTNARPAGRDLEPKGHSEAFWAAGLLPPAYTALYQPRYLSDDGSHLFFESFEALVPRDTNGKEDVYEFEPAESSAECEAMGAELFLAAQHGCLSLISSGLSPVDSSFVDASPSGRDVFFSTNASLVPQDPGLIDIYDAREGGGFPPPATPSPECEGDACQSPGPPPNDQTPASSTFEGPGNLHERPAKRCAKGHRKVRRHGKVVCVKKRLHGHGRHHHGKGAGR